MNEESEVISTEGIDLNDAYEYPYTMRVVGGSVGTCIPKNLVERKARQLGITVEEFIKDYEVVMMCNSFKKVDGAFIFRKKKEK